MPRSKPEETLLAALTELFPNDVIVEQMPLKVGRSTLFVDFVIKDKKLAFETDGRQHDEYVEHLHGDAEGFKASKLRDVLKECALEELGYTLVRFKHNESVTVKSVRKRLLDSLR
jgi:very-short-patch-repair endonuclease